MTHAYEEIAPRLRGLRDAMDMSVAELAELVNTDPELVEKYESGTVEIPVSYLFEVAQASKIDLTVLISGGEAHLRTSSVVRKDAGLTVDRRKDYDYKSLAYKFTGRKMEPFTVTVPPKEKEELTFSKHSGQEFIYMLEGTLEATVGERVLVLEAGDSLYFDPQAEHALRGLNGKPATFLDVII